MDCYPQVFCFTFLLACAVVCQAVNVQLGASSTDVEEHDQVVLTCSVTADVDVITWSHEAHSHDAHEVHVDDETKFKYELIQSGGTTEGKLTILKMEHESEGSYKCTASGMTSNDVNLRATHHIHHVTTSRSTVPVADGSTLTLNCQADIHTDVVWFKGSSTPLEHGKDQVTITVKKDPANHLLTSTLTIGSTSDHTGTYSCKSAHKHDHEDEDADEAVITVVKGLEDTSRATTHASPGTSFKVVMCSALLTSLVLFISA